jgi:hypothetical protein
MSSSTRRDGRWSEPKLTMNPAIPWPTTGNKPSPCTRLRDPSTRHAVAAPLEGIAPSTRRLRVAWNDAVELGIETPPSAPS